MQIGCRDGGMKITKNSFLFSKGVSNIKKSACSEGTKLKNGNGKDFTD